MRVQLTFVVGSALLTGCSPGPTRRAPVPAADAAREAAPSVSADAAPLRDAGPLQDAAPVQDASVADASLPSGERDAEIADARIADAGVALDRPSFEAPVDRPRLPDGQFHYPSLDGKLCGSDEYVLPRFKAEVLVLLDRSGSMTGKLGASTKWQDAANVVKAAVTNNRDVSWGLKLFPSGSQACAASPTVEVPLAMGSGPAITTAVDGTGPEGEGTPITAVMKAATAHLQSLPPTGPKHIVLVTDGAPTCRDGDPNARDEGEAVAAIETAARAGFPTLVIGLAAAAADAVTLDKMAVAGGSPRGGTPRYYPAGSQAELSAVLDAIVASLTPCVFPLANPPLDPSYVTVTVDRTPLPRDLLHKQGWDYVNNGGAIRIYGGACDDLKRGAASSAGIFYGCPY